MTTKYMTNSAKPMKYMQTGLSSTARSMFLTESSFKAKVNVLFPKKYRTITDITRRFPLKHYLNPKKGQQHLTSPSPRYKSLSTRTNRSKKSFQKTRFPKRLTSQKQEQLQQTTKQLLQTQLKVLQV